MDPSMSQYNARMQINEAEDFLSNFEFSQESRFNPNKNFPFEDYSSIHYYPFIFPDGGMNNDYSMYEDNMLDKLSSSFDNYNSILKHEFFQKVPSNFLENLKLAEKTLPGNIIKLMVEEDGPITFDKLLLNLQNKIGTFRKANGCKYSGDPRNAILSTLKTSNIFYKVEEGLYYFKEDNAQEFLLRNYEREMKKKIIKEKSVSKGKKSLNSSLSSNKRDTDTRIGFLTLKIQKINLILEQMIKKFRSDPRYDELRSIVSQKNKFSLQQLKEYCEKDKFIAMLMCLKYFKSLSKLYLLIYFLSPKLSEICWKKKEH
ncbi:MAG: hypothetical protein MJ252_03895 [archaeon]|nr:hypothetical protein [archaeon]